MKLFFISDVHGEIKHFSSVRDLISESDVVIIGGDLTKNGSREEAEKVLFQVEKYNKNILSVHGNWDNPEVLELLEQKEYSIHQKGRCINGIGFFGAGGSNPTPLHTVSEYEEDKIFSFLKTGYKEVGDVDRYVLVSHAPPKKIRDRTFFGARVGSESVRKFLDEHNIDLCLVGHIHEASGMEEYRSCLVVNSGSFKKGKYSSISLGNEITVTQGKTKK